MRNIKNKSSAGPALIFSTNNQYALLKKISIFKLNTNPNIVQSMKKKINDRETEIDKKKISIRINSRKRWHIRRKET